MQTPIVTPRRPKPAFASRFLRYHRKGMRYGLVLTGASIVEQIEAARLAESRGLYSVWTTEFFNQNGFVRLAAVAAATERVRLGTGIAYAFMRTPMLAASAAMDLDEISGGRVILGLGSGTRNMNEKWYSVPFEHPPAPRMREAVALIRAAFAEAEGDGLTFEGRYYQVSIPQYQRSGMARPSIPIYVAAVNRGMVRAAATSDGLCGHPVYTRHYISECVLPELDGRDCELVPYVITAVADNSEQARNEARNQIAFYYSTRIYHSILEPHGWSDIGEEIAQAFRRGDFKAMVAAVTDEMVDAIAAAGTPDEVRDRLKQWEGLTDHALLYSPSAGLDPARVRENVSAIAETVDGLSA
ncbi:MAG: LLM class flavin-dependent oxidoreductase [Acidobacteriota bacterium]|nr:LLM class flavin-dependent oxidoreductase [Acidobacteriota bacterium]